MAFLLLFYSLVLTKIEMLANWLGSGVFVWGESPARMHLNGHLGKSIGESWASHSNVAAG